MAIKNRAIVSLTLMSIALTTTVTFAQSTAISAGAFLTPLSELEDTLTHTPNVGGFGRSLFGLRRGDAPGPLTISDLAVSLPAARAMLCFRLSTRDGNYFGSRRYRVDAPTPGLAPLSLKSQYAGEIRRYAADELAVRAQLRRNCDQGDAGVLIATSFQPLNHSTLLAIDLSVGRASPDITLLDAIGKPIEGLDGAPMSHLPCGHPFEGDTAYDHECKVIVPAGEWSSVKAIEVNIFTVTGRQRSEIYPVDLGPL